MSPLHQHSRHYRDLGIERVAIPSKDAMHAYDRDASVWLSEILTNEKENLRLANLRDALLPKLMSGEIDASKVDLTQLNSHLASKPYLSLYCREHFVLV